MKHGSFILPLLLMACRTNSPEPATEPMTTATTEVALAQPAVMNSRGKSDYCTEWSQISCATSTDVFAPHLCSVAFVGSDIQQVRGDNYCAVIHELNEKFCKTDLVRDDTRFKVDCAPDATQGECPPEATLCELGNNEGPAKTCVIDTYEGNELPENYHLKIVGADACFIKSSLYKQACAINLRPSLLGEPRCE